MTRPPRPLCALCSVFLCSVLLSGCTLSNNAAPGTQSLQLSGIVMGGALPVGGSHIYLFAAGTTTYAGPGIAASTANASTSLLKSASGVTTADANGNFYYTAGPTGEFFLQGDYTACTTGQQLYLYGTSGNATGSSASPNNAAIGPLAALGTCGNAQSTGKIILNEMSTVAAAYSLAGFATDPAHISDDEAATGNTTQAFARTGMANAFANPANIVNLAGGAPYASAPAGSTAATAGTVPVDTMNTIANLLAGCIQSTSSSARPCSDLFTFTGTTTGYLGNADTAAAAINLAQHPAGVAGSSVSIGTLFNDLPTQTDFVPNLSSAPNDFTLAIAYSTGSGSSPYGVAVDAAGNVWEVNYSTNSYGTFMAPTYAGTLTVTPNLGQPQGIAIDTNGTAWVSNFANFPANMNDGYVTSIQSPGSAGTTFPFFGVTLGPGIAIDGSNNVWSVDTEYNELFQLEPGGSQVIFTNPATFHTPYGVAVDATGVVWMADNTVAELDTLPSYDNHFPDGTTYPNNTLPFVDSYSDLFYYDAVDSAGNIWSSGGTDIVRYVPGAGTSTGTFTSFTGGGLYEPNGIALDGSSNVWVSNLSNAISEFNNAGAPLSPSAGFIGTAGSAGGTSGPQASTYQIAVDGSGNVWSVDNTNNVLVEFIGAATPVLVPLAQAIHFTKIATRP